MTVALSPGFKSIIASPANTPSSRNSMVTPVSGWLPALVTLAVTVSVTPATRQAFTSRESTAKSWRTTDISWISSKNHSSLVLKPLPVLYRNLNPEWYASPGRENIICSNGSNVPNPLFVPGNSFNNFHDPSLAKYSRNTLSPISRSCSDSCIINA